LKEANKVGLQIEDEVPTIDKIKNAVYVLNCLLASSTIIVEPVSVILGATALIFWFTLYVI
jgi:hypothetical protein